MKKRITKWLAALLGVCALTAVAAADHETRTIPVKDITSKLKVMPHAKLGGKAALVTEKDVTIQVAGKAISAKEYVLQYSKNNTLTLTCEFAEPLNLKDDWNLVQIFFQFDGDTKPGDILSWNMLTADRKNIRGRMPFYHDADKVWKLDWEPMLDPNWGLLRDLSSVKSFTFVLRLDKWEDKDKTCTIRISDITLVKHPRWAEKYPDKKKKWDAWLEFQKNYKFDLSDSSKYLLPPETGRIPQALSLVKGGKANAEIVVTKKDPYGVIENAVKDFNHHVELITGTKLPVVEKPGAMPVKIVLDTPDAEKKFAKELAFLRDLKPHYGEDGFYIRTEGNTIYLGGAVATGTRNALYRLLENNTTLLWGRQVGHYATVYDETPDINILWADVLDKPLVPFRGWRGAEDKWSARNGANDSINTELGGRGNLLGNFSDYLPNKPPYQCYVNGEYLKMGYYSSQVCISQPDSYDLVINKMLERIKKERAAGKRVSSINWVTEDNWYVCCCDGCVAPITLPDGTVLSSTGISMKESMSAEEKKFRCNQFYLFANRLARDLKKHYPDVQLQVLAYFFMEPAPLFKREDNMQVVFAPLYSRPDMRNPIFAPSNNGVWGLRDAQTKAGGHMGLYEYYFHPPIADMLRWEIADYMDVGFQNFGSEIPGEKGTVESRIKWDTSAVDYWVTNRLMWNYEQDVTQLRKYFFRRMYREGAPVIEKIYAIALENYHKGIWGTHAFPFESLIQRYIIEAGNGAEHMKALEAGLDQIKNPLARINYGRFMKRYQLLYNNWLIKTGKKKAPVVEDTSLPKDTVKLFRNEIMFRLRNTDEATQSTTTIERNKDFPDVLRLRFNNVKTKSKQNISTYSIFHAKWMGSKARIPFPGRIRMKIRPVTPGVSMDKIPFFGVWGRTGEEVNKLTDIQKVGKDTYEITYCPDGKHMDLGDLTGIKFMYPRQWIKPDKGYVEFDIFDVRVEKVPPPKNISAGDDLFSEMESMIED